MIILEVPTTQLALLIGEDITTSGTGIDCVVAFGVIQNTNDPATNQSLQSLSPIRVKSFDKKALTAIVSGLTNNEIVLKSMSFCNTDSVTHTLTMAIKDPTSSYIILSAYSLTTGKTLIYEDGNGWSEP